MIKFFQKTRQNLLKEGKTTRYFKYAIGEIVLVVIGILIALQINNVNESRIDKTRALSYLDRIVDNLETDKMNIKIRLKFWLQVSEFGKTALNYSSKGEKVNISDWEVLLSFFQASQLFEFITTKTTYDEITGAGELGLIQNIKIRSKIANYYTNSGNLALSERPIYREHIRGVFPIDIQYYIWESCYESNNFSEQVLINCTSPISPQQTKDLLKKITSNETLIQELRFWVSTLKVALVIATNQLKETTVLIEIIKAELMKVNT
jgi:hypothetical protein